MESRLGGSADTGSAIPSTIVPQHWWRGPGYFAIPPVGWGGTKGDAGEADKEIQSTESPIGTDQGHGSENQQLPHVSSAMPPMLPQYLAPHMQMEVGQSVACAAYTYPDPYYSGLMAAYGSQALMHPQLPGMPHNRMPLPLEMMEEPVYVNAKQYNGIMRRRQSRAKLELEKKLVKARKPYLHESRHQHAMRRARGCGGRFLNKKSDASAADPNPEKGPASVPPDSASCEGPNRRTGFLSSAFHPTCGEEMEGAEQQQRGGILVNRPPNRNVAIK